MPGLSVRESENWFFQGERPIIQVSSPKFCCFNCLPNQIRYSFIAVLEFLFKNLNPFFLFCGFIKTCPRVFTVGGRIMSGYEWYKIFNGEFLNVPIRFDSVIGLKTKSRK
jgi:hypothetical protein